VKSREFEKNRDVPVCGVLMLAGRMLQIGETEKGLDRAHQHRMCYPKCPISIFVKEKPFTIRVFIEERPHFLAIIPGRIIESGEMS
jgi:hypothetical protein